MVQNTIFRPRSDFVKAFFSSPRCNPPSGPQFVSERTPAPPPPPPGQGQAPAPIPAAGLEPLDRLARLDENLTRLSRQIDEALTSQEKALLKQQAFDRLRELVEEQNAEIFARRVARNGGVIGNSTVIPNG